MKEQDLNINENLNQPEESTSGYEEHKPVKEEKILSSEEKAEKDSQFEKEFMPLISSLYNFAYRLTLDEDDANDLVQETYLKAPVPARLLSRSLHARLQTYQM